MSVPDDLLYTRSHEWVKIDGDTVTVGITQYAQDQLGEVVYVDLPSEGDSVSAGDTFGEIESVKAVSEFFAPATGEVSAVNEKLADEPNLVNEDPYGDGWLVKISGSAEEDELLDAAAYEAHIEEESH